MKNCLIAFALIVSFACGDDDGGTDSGGVDAGRSDAGFDAGSDAGGVDAGADAGTDAGADAATDAAIDAAMDAAAMDAALDAAMDSGVDASMDAGMDSGVAACDDELDLFPVPVDEATTLFDFVDDGFLVVTFARGFTFPFFGTTYDEMVVGTNGSMVFGDDPTLEDIASELDNVLADVLVPTIAPFWGDLDAGVDPEAIARAMQMTTQQCDDRFVIRYTDYNDHDDATWQNTAIVTLFDDGEIEFAYGTVETEDILVGVFDGSHTDDMLVAAPFAATYAIGTSTGIVLFDAFETDATQHLGELNDLTIRFTP